MRPGAKGRSKCKLMEVDAEEKIWDRRRRLSDEGNKKEHEVNFNMVENNKSSPKTFL